MCVSDEGCSGNVSCALNLISMFLFLNTCMHNRNSESQWFNVDIFIGLQKLLSTFTKRHCVDSTAVFILIFFTYLPENQSGVRVTRSCKFATVMVFIATFHNIRESSSNVSHTYYVMTNIR